MFVPRAYILRRDVAYRFRRAFVKTHLGRRNAVYTFTLIVNTRACAPVVKYISDDRPVRRFAVRKRRPDNKWPKLRSAGVSINMYELVLVSDQCARPRVHADGRAPVFIRRQCLHDRVRPRVRFPLSPLPLVRAAFLDVLFLVGSTALESNGPGTKIGLVR